MPGRSVRFGLALGFAAGFGFSALHAESALEALKQLPKDKAENVAQIIGHDGTPEPDRWSFIAYDKDSENGVHEYVVAKGEVVASRTLSQFAQSVKPGEVLRHDTVKLDSTAAAKIATEYAHANNVVIARIDFQLRKEGEEAAPVWKLTCFDDAGKQIGEVLLTAGKATVVSHEGFAVVPPDTDTKFDSYASSTVETSGTDGEKQNSSSGNSHKTAQKKKSDDSDSTGHTISKPFRKAGGHLQKFFTGKDTISQ